MHEYTVHPRQFGMQTLDGDSSALRVADAAASTARIHEALADEPGPVRDIVLLNAGAALCCATIAPTLGEGVEQAREAVRSGAAARKLAQFVQTTQGL